MTPGILEKGRGARYRETASAQEEVKRPGRPIGFPGWRELGDGSIRFAIKIGEMEVVLVGGSHLSGVQQNSDGCKGNQTKGSLQGHRTGSGSCGIIPVNIERD
jgi:hypothetical protein